MAEFKLGRIKFVFQGAWDNAQNYVVDDVVTNGGKTYICTSNHTSSTLFATDYNTNPELSKWDLAADGLSWYGAWVAGTYFEIGTLAQWGGIVYVCTESHTSATYTSPDYLGLEDDSDKWEVFATSFDWKGGWASTTRYKVNDLISYGGYTYVANQKHISSGTLETDLTAGYWDTFNAGIRYVGTWSGSSASYKINDVVKFGADLWICTTTHTSSGATIDLTKFSIFVNGFEFENTWSGGTAYQIGDIVAYGGYTYTCILNHTTSQTPSTATTYWQPFTTGFSFEGDWLVGTTYKIGQVVRLGGYTYVATADGAGHKPPNGSYWKQLNSGLKWNPTSGTYTTVDSSNIVSATGNGNAKFDVIASGTTYAVTVTSGQGGGGYALSDTLKILGTDVGGATPANDITLTVTGQSGGAITSVDVSGISVTWANGVTYVLGDVVLWGVSSYICVSAHVASSGTNRPDVDATGTYWNLLASGTEQAVMTTQGDMFIYGTNGPERLPAGTEGTILRVKNGIPAWSYYGLVNNIVYVAPSGTDSEDSGYGLTIDTPWKTVRFACEQIEKGYQNRSSTALLEKNKQFALKEVNNYIQYTYPGVCDPDKTERDAGYIFDALVHDLGHGGTLEIITNVRAYYDDAGTAYINSAVEAQITEFIAAQTYLQSLVTDILANTAPATNYQTLNSVVTQAEQIIDTSLVPESGVTDIVDNLMTLVINGLGAGTALELPTALRPQTTVSVKTGTYNEVLPIVIPRYTAVVGDELRSTVIQPKAAIDSLVNDKPKTIAALNRIKAVIPDLFANNAITPTTGNTQTQDITLPDGDVGSTTATTRIETNAAIIADIVENGLGVVPSFSFTNPTGYNVGFLNGYGDGKAQIVQNYAFIKDEIASYLNTNYNSVWTALGVSGQDDCKRDVGYILDALQYDMTYGGNTQSLIVGSTYYSFSQLVIGSTEYEATVAAYTWLKSFIDNIVVANTAGWVKNTALSQVTSGTPGSIGASTFAQDRVQDIIDWITNNSAPTTVLPTAAIALASSALQTAYTALQARRTEIQSDTVVWVKKFYQDMAFNSDTCYRDAGLIVDALSYDMIFGSNFNSITAGRSYLRTTASVVLASQLEAELGSINFIKYKAGLIAASGSTAQATAIIDNITAYITGTTIPEVHGTISYNNTLSTINGVEVLRANKTFLSYEATAYITQSYGGTVTTTTASTNLFALGSAHNFVAGDPVVFSGTTYSGSGITLGTTYYVLASGLTGTEFKVSETPAGTEINITSNGSGSSLIVRYSYDEASCRRDMAAYVDALVYDLQFSGNYKSLRAAQLYVNAVDGSEESDMFQVSNASGLRNCTLSGLVGTLSAANSYGTQRPTAGAFVALNPGFGPNDSRVWVANRSHYSQNVTMFGVGCTGAKIDAALHAGGNKSMVKNDFTTIISDGIGVWCTGSGSLTELVSVFNYYGYAGYLAELGGRIRATNGNSSYGTYGVVAEGTDTYETPIYATLDNRAVDAYITNVVTDGVNEILRFEYANAGSNYSNASPSINGSGYNATATQDEFRDSAVFETRIVDLDDGNGVGGTSYVTQANAAQEGTATEITIAATDTALSNSYNGMRIQIVAGTGVGQYGNIITYNNGTKVAQVWKDSVGALTVTGSTTTVLEASLVDVAKLYVNQPLFFTATTAGILNANQVYYVESIASTTTFTVKSTTGGSAITGLTATSGQTITMYQAGWDHVVSGTTIETVLDLTTQYIIEPRIGYSAPGYTATATTVGSTSTQWVSAAYGANRFVAISGNATTTAYSSNGTTWTNGGALTASTHVDVVYGGGEGAVATAVVGGLGGSGAVLTAVVGPTGQVNSVTVENGGYNFTTIPVITFTGGGGFGATGVATILDGAIASVEMEINGSGYTGAPTVNIITSEVTEITSESWGKNYFSTPTVTIAPPYSATAWSSGGSGTSGTYYSYLGNFYRATSNGTFTTSGPTHTTGSVTNGTVPLLYVGTQATATPNLTNYGVSSFTITNNGYGYTSIPSVTVLDTSAKFVAIRNGASATSAYSTVANLSSSWTAGNTLASKTDMAALAYGGGIYVAVGGTSGTASAASSTDGITWTDRSSAITALSGGSYGAITYGNGVFIATNNGGITTSYSTNGVTWTAGGNLPNVGSNYWTNVAYGNGRFVAVQGNGGASTSVAYSIDKGATWTAVPAGIGSSQTWTRVKYAQGMFVAIASGTQYCATSPDGIVWTVRTTGMPSSSNWKALTFGNPGGVPTWAAISNTSGTTGASIVTGATTAGRVRVVSNVITEIRMTEPGSAYPKGTITAVTGGATDTVSTSDTTNLTNLQPIEFTGLDAYGLTTNTTYYIVTGSIVSNTSFQVSTTSGGSAVNLTTGTGLSGTYRAGPITTITDPNKVKAVNVRVRNGDGVLGNPSFSNRGLNNATATATTSGDGYADIYQSSQYINVSGLYSIPTAGANVEFSSITGDNSWYKLVTVTNVLGDAGNYTATFQINPALTTRLAPAHADQITTRLAYSQVRLTGHDFLYIGTGNQSDTNYPYVDPTMAIQANQQASFGGGRVFFTSTDQDGNFNVGNLFGVQQATGTATLNASAFNLAGLQSLQLGAVTLGVGSAVITQFSTDPYFTANSDAVVPTQRAIKAFITAQIGGGQSSLNVNTLTAGQVYIANNSISNTTGAAIYVTSKMSFNGGIDGAPVALAYFGQR